MTQKTMDNLYDCMDRADVKGFEKHIRQYLKTTDESTASIDLTMLIMNDYTAAKADGLAKLLEIIIRCNPNLALINYPENHFFRMCMIRGSMDLFECFTEEAIEPHLENSSEEEYIAYYNKLLLLAVELNSIFTDQYKPQIKGVHFNGAFAKNDAGIVQIHAEDFEAMDDIVDIYNTMIGRRDIIKTLMTNSGMKF